MNKDEAQRWAAEFRRDLEGIEGPLPIERIARTHLSLFIALRESGTPWPQVAALMNRAGVRRRDGVPLTPAQWRAMISRLIANADTTRNSSATPVGRDLLAKRPPPTPITASPSPPNVTTKLAGSPPAPAAVDASMSEIRQRMKRASAIRRTEE